MNDDVVLCGGPHTFARRWFHFETRMSDLLSGEVMPVGFDEWYGDDYKLHFAWRSRGRTGLCPMRGSRFSICLRNNRGRQYEYEYAFARRFAQYAYNRMRNDGAMMIRFRCSGRWAEWFNGYHGTPQGKCFVDEFRSELYYLSGNDNVDDRNYYFEVIGDELIIINKPCDDKPIARLAMEMMYTLRGISRHMECIEDDIATTRSHVELAPTTRG